MIVTLYSEDALASSLANSYTSKASIKSKNHFGYLHGYLSHTEIQCKTIVVEDNYISKDYLHDYSSYYSLCYESYPKVCTRVHFFSLDFTEAQFNDMLLGKFQNESIPGSYLGFVVVKPIPFTVLGYTLLKTYFGSPSNRLFWGNKKYTVHLYGKKLFVESLAFQEQDTILSACATTAIWSMLNKASDLQIAQIKTPSEITRDAGHLSSDGNRLFPNKGLDVFQICQAIYKAGLVTEVKQPDVDLPSSISNAPLRKVVSKQYLKKLLNAYSSVGIPIILVVAVPNRNRQGTITYGYHALTVCGFKQKDPVPIPATPNIISWHADNINKLYAHDDQWGPFVRIEWVDDHRVSTLWDDSQNKTFVYRVIIPTFPKIRIPYEDIQVIVEGLDTILTAHWDNNIKEDLVWDIKVEYSENYKQQLNDLNPSNFPNKLIHLKKSFPKYVWIATCYISGLPIIKFVFDATGVSQAMLGVDIITLLPQPTVDTLYNFLIVNSYKPDMVNVFSHWANQEYYDFFMNNIKS